MSGITVLLSSTCSDEVAFQMTARLRHSLLSSKTRLRLLCRRIYRRQHAGPGRLPEEILLEIFRLCLVDGFALSDANQAPLSLMATCRQWRRIAHDSSLWSRVSLVRHENERPCISISHDDLGLYAKWLRWFFNIRVGRPISRLATSPEPAPGPFFAGRSAVLSALRRGEDEQRKNQPMKARVQSLRIEATYAQLGTIFEVLNCDFSRLVSLDITIAQTPEDDIPGRRPVLRTGSLFNLAKLSIRDDNRLDAQTSLDLSGIGPRLTSISFKNVRNSILRTGGQDEARFSQLKFTIQEEDVVHKILNPGLALIKHSKRSSTLELGLLISHHPSWLDHGRLSLKMVNELAQLALQTFEGEGKWHRRTQSTFTQIETDFKTSMCCGDIQNMTSEDLDDFLGWWPCKLETVWLPLEEYSKWNQKRIDDAERVDPSLRSFRNVIGMACRNELFRRSSFPKPCAKTVLASAFPELEYLYVEITFLKGTIQDAVSSTETVGGANSSKEEEEREGDYSRRRKLRSWIQRKWYSLRSPL